MCAYTKRVARPFQNVVYLQVRRRWLGLQTITFSGRASQWSGIPEVVFARDAKGRERAHTLDDPMLLTAIGHRPFVAFNHARVLVDSAADTSSALALFLRKVSHRTRWPASSVFVVHVQDEWTAGLAEIERAALMKIAKELGAQRVFLLTGGRDLLPPELIRLARRKPDLPDDVLAFEY